MPAVSMRPMIPALALALGLAGPGCGGERGPQTPEALVERVVEALAQGDEARFRAVLPTVEEIEREGPAKDHKPTPEELARVAARMERQAMQAFAALRSEERGFDWRAARITGIEVEEGGAEGGMTLVDVRATVVAGETSGILNLQGVRLRRGHLLARPPRLTVEGTPCDTAIRHMIALGQASESEDERLLAAAMAKDLAGTVDACERDLAADPGAKAKLACVLAAKTMSAAAECGQIH